MEVVKYILENELELIPALYILGMIIKDTEKIPNKYIPIILLGFGIIGSISLMGVSTQAVIQGILVTGAAVYTNQLFKQMKRE